MAALCALTMGVRAGAQNRGVYPLGMSAINSGATSTAGFAYVNQLLFYARDEATDNAGNTLPVTGQNYVLMDMNTFVWVSPTLHFLGGAAYSVSATLPFAKNDLTSDVQGRISGGSGFADSYYQPFILGWRFDRLAIRAAYGFLAPTGRFAVGASDNVGSGYWTHAVSSGQTGYLLSGRQLAVSAFEMYEFHTTQAGTGVQPGQTFDLDYSILGRLPAAADWRLQAGLVGYAARQTTARTGPGVSPESSAERYAINSLGVAVAAVVPNSTVSLSLKYFREFSNRATYQGSSLQLSTAVTF